MAIKKRLGRELDNLLNISYSQKTLSNLFREPSLCEFKKIPIQFLYPSRFQPRTAISEENVQELAESIKIHGVLQPIVVRMIDDAHYEIVAGERRWRAAQLAQLQDIPVLIKDVSDYTACAMALIENIQREDLNPIEKAQALHRLMNEFQVTHAEMAKILGKSRTHITNTLRLLHLNEAVQKLISDKQIEMGHARALLSLDFKKQKKAAEWIARHSLSVRETEQRVQRWLRSSEKKVRIPILNANKTLLDLQNQLSEKLKMLVNIHPRQKESGTITIRYRNLKELQEFLNRIR